MNEPSGEAGNNPLIHFFVDGYRKQGVAGLVFGLVFAITIGWTVFPLLAETWYHRLAIVGTYVTALGALGSLFFGAAPFVAPVLDDAAASLEAWGASLEQFVTSNPFMAAFVVFLIGLGIITVSAIARVIDR